MKALSKRDIYGQCREKSADGNKSTFRQLWEILWLYLRMGYGPAFYHEARFWRKEVTVSKMTRYLIGAKYKKKVNTINDTRYYKASQNKFIEKAILTLSGIPTPKYIGYITHQGGDTPDGKEHACLNQITELLKSRPAGKFCTKAVEGFGGHSFRAFEVCSIEPMVKVRPLPDGKEMLFTDFVADQVITKGSGKVIVEEYLDQHPAMAALNPTSVNTIRVWVRQKGHRTRAVAGIARIGQEGSLTDNASGGGLVAPVDLKSGVIGKAYYIDGRHRYFESHPDHSAQIEGISIPMWEQVKATACRAVTAFPGINFAGVDIAVGIHEPVVIELNVEPGSVHATVVDVPTADLLE